MALELLNAVLNFLGYEVGRFKKLALAYFITTRIDNICDASLAIEV